MPNQDNSELKYSKNETAEKIVGRRPTGGIIIDFPCELGYHCPVCKYDLVTDGNYDERLDWSEYNTFIWCSVCNKDYPSALCMPDIDKATETYLSSVSALLQKEVEKARIDENRETRIDLTNERFAAQASFKTLDINGIDICINVVDERYKALTHIKQEKE